MRKQREIQDDGYRINLIQKFEMMDIIITFIQKFEMMVVI
jgi:hypothetical protein